MIRKVVLDVLKPQNPSILEFSSQLSKIKGIKKVEIVTTEMDREVETVKITLYGNIRFEEVRRVLEDLGASIHSIDEVVAGKRL